MIGCGFQLLAKPEVLGIRFVLSDSVNGCVLDRANRSTKGNNAGEKSYHLERSLEGNSSIQPNKECVMGVFLSVIRNEAKDRRNSR